MTRGVLPSGWLGRWDGAARVEIYFVTIAGSDAGRKTIYGGKFTVSPNPRCRILRMFGKEVTDIRYAENWIRVTNVIVFSPLNPPPLARGEVCHRAPPKTDKHGIHQGSGKHVTSSTLQSYSVTLLSGCVISWRQNLKRGL